MESAIRQGAMKSVVLLVVIAIVMAPTAASATDQIVMLVPGISGSSMLAGHAGWIEVLSFAGSAVAPTSTGLKQSCQMTVQKPLDIASPHLWVATANGQTFTTIRIQLLAPGVGGSLFVLYDIQLINAEILSIGDSGSNTLPLESLTLKAASVTLTFNTQNTGGVITSTTTSFTC